MSIVVTGGGSGIGAATARHFAMRGAQVTICGRQGDAIDEVARSIGPNCRAVRADITIADDRRRLIDEAVGHGGGLEVLVNNAGNMYRGAIDSLNEASLLDVFHVNVVAAMLLTGLAVPHLERRRGAVIFIGSIHNRRAFPGASPYAATKGAVLALSQSLAAELGAKSIRVNCVVPGAVPTHLNVRAGLAKDFESARARLEGLAPLHALRRIGTPEEVAEAIDYLVRSEWTTGAVLDVDGGLGLGLTDA
ncbi:MAG: SDR family oxidoreductase [Gammaproteobacteria bacterium]|nr:SDR family oxidoreductase [Gammaproteobacteria bacterium]